MFALRMPNVSQVTSYERAAHMFAHSTPRKTTAGKSGTHMLPGHHTAMTGVSRGSDRAIMFTYHSTNVVTWYPDNSLVLDLSYRSVSTAAFASRFVPDSISVSGEANHLTTHRSDRHYIPASIVRITPNGEVKEPGVDTVPIVQTTYDRKATKKVLDGVGYPAFRKWYMHMRPLLGDKQVHRDATTAFDVEDAVRDPDKWDQLLHTARFNGGWRGMNVPSAENFLSAVRNNIYDSYDVEITTEHEYAKSWTQFDNWRK